MINDEFVIINPTKDLHRRTDTVGEEPSGSLNGQEGIDMTYTENPDIILLDMSLPIVDGWGVAKHLKADEKVKHIPIIALTAHAMAGDREKTLEAGCDEYYTKPIKLPGLLELIEKFTS